MLEKRRTLFKLMGFEVRLDWSWLILAFLVTWSLATGYFPMKYKNLSQVLYWWMGVAGAVGVFVSIVFHELSHSLVAKRHGLRMKGITLFIFGGVAEMEEEPPSAKAEFYMAIAGPLASLFLAGIFYLVFLLSKVIGWPDAIRGIILWLMTINIVLAVFNCLPAFPTDGGRVLRSILWSWKKNLRWATHISSEIGAAFGLVLIILGVINIVGRNFVGGMWWVLIGMFLRSASRSSYQRLLTRKFLEGEKVRDFMKTDPVTVPADITIHQLVEDYFYKHHYKMFPVLKDVQVIGCITTRDVKEISKTEWGEKTVGEVAGRCTQDNSISPDTDAMQALSSMNKTHNSRLMVMEDGRLLGILTLKDMLKFLSMKLDLEGYEEDIGPLQR